MVSALETVSVSGAPMAAGFPNWSRAWTLAVSFLFLPPRLNEPAQVTLPVGAD